MKLLTLGYDVTTDETFVMILLIQIIGHILNKSLDLNSAISHVFVQVVFVPNFKLYIFYFLKWFINKTNIHSIT